MVIRGFFKGLFDSFVEQKNFLFRILSDMETLGQQKKTSAKLCKNCNFNGGKKEFNLET